MNSIFQTVERILTAESSSLRELAAIAGVDPEVMYAGADFRGVPLTQDDRDLLLGCGGIVDDASTGKNIGSSQRVVEDTATAARKISEIRTKILARYFEAFIRQGTAHPVFSFVKSLLDPDATPKRRKEIEADFVALVILEVQRYREDFFSKASRISLIKAMNSARFNFGVREFHLIRSLSRDALTGSTFFDTFNLQLCTGGFLRAVIEFTSNNFNDPTNSFVAALLERMQSVSFELAEYLVGMAISSQLLPRLVISTRGLDLAKNREKIAAKLLDRVTSAYQIDLFVAALSSSPALQRKFIYFALRSPQLDISIAALKACSETGIPVGNLEFGEILFGFSDFESKLRFAVRAERLVPATSLRILVDELRQSAKTLYELGAIERNFPSLKF